MGRGERWGRWPYRVLGVVLVVAGIGVHHLPDLRATARAVVSLVGLLLLVAGVVLLVGPLWHRARGRQEEEIRRNPTGRNTSLDERLARVDHPRARWVLSLVLALGFSLATVWAAVVAIRKDESAFVGFAIYLFVPVPFFWWLTWRTRALLRRP